MGHRANISLGPLILLLCSAGCSAKWLFSGVSGTGRTKENARQISRALSKA
jgi:hypothetical protein